MMVRQGFFSFFNCSSRFLLKLRSAKLYSKNKHGAQHMSCFDEFKYSSSCIPKCNSFYLIFWDGDMPFLTISFEFHDLQVVRNEVFQPITFFLGVILV